MKKGFTLIELLIVVAIIAILAAIAVPNFLEAQTRAKVSRVKADMRTLDTAIKIYFLDNNKNPTDGVGSDAGAGRPQGGPSSSEAIGNELTTPIAYITSLSIAKDIFKSGRPQFDGVGAPPPNAVFPGRDVFIYRDTLGLLSDPLINAVTKGVAEREIRGRTGTWRLTSAGPDQFVFNNTIPGQDFQDVFVFRNYDATNGTISIGDIFRTERFVDLIVEQLPPPTP
ncbi:MAG: type II secretion system protein [Sumerlaeia bacterium]